jgi:hypothetical protein
VLLLKAASLADLLLCRSMSRSPRRRLSAREIEGAVDEMVDEFAGRLGIPHEDARRVLYAIVSVMNKHGVTFEMAIEALADKPAPKPN